MAETPRPWTLVVRGNPPFKEPPIEVIEKAPVDTERERMLDLLEEWLFSSSALKVAEATHDLLREHGRLPKEER